MLPGTPLPEQVISAPCERTVGGQDAYLAMTAGDDKKQTQARHQVCLNKSFFVTCRNRISSMNGGT
jgi:hypothetical protein